MHVANRAHEVRASAWSWAAAGLLIVGALSQRGAPGAGVGAERIGLDQAGGSSENWSILVPLVSFAAHPRSR